MGWVAIVLVLMLGKLEFGVFYMIRFKTHFCLVSAQAAPNLLPLLDSDMKPEKVVLLVTEPMRQRANYLEKVIKPRGIKVEQHELVISDDFDSMQEQLLELIANETAEPEEIALNATGGTKWMAIAAQEVFRMNGSAVFYVDVDSGQSLFLEKGITAHKLSESIDLKNYIEAYGYEFKGQPQTIGMKQPLREFCQELVLNVQQWQGAIGQLNQLAAEADLRKTLRVSLADTLRGRDQELDNLLREAEYAGLLTLKGDSLSFADEEARTFANGGWLEFYVNDALNKLKAEGVLQDSPKVNLHIQRQGETSHNEVDVCFMAKNRLHLIECKTKRMSGKGTAAMTTDTMYKLDSISELGGLASKSMLVSYRTLNHADKQRAKDLRIKVIETHQLQQLRSHLANWINS